jgi:hypothetical protein
MTFEITIAEKMVYNPKEIPVEHSNNIYTDGEFRLELTEGTELYLMPNMKWITVIYLHQKNLFFYILYKSYY